MILFNIDFNRISNKKYFKKILKSKKKNIFKIILLLLLLIIIIKYIYSEIKFKFFRKSLYDKNWLKETREKHNYTTEPSPLKNNIVPKGFIGGGLGYESDFDTPEFNNIPIMDNHIRDNEGTRMIRGWWPEFNWFEYPNTKSNRRVFTLAHQDIVRMLYNDKGEILSIICPQMGHCIHKLGCVKIEVTVTHIKGWVNENKKTCKGVFKGHIKLWIDKYDTNNETSLIKYIKKNYKGDLPFSKKNAIIVPFYSDKKLTNDKIKFESRNNIKPNLHPESWIVISFFNGLYVGDISNKNNYKIDKLIVDLASIYTSNFFIKGNHIQWNIYGLRPELVDKEEYKKHVDELKISYQLDKDNPLRGFDFPYINENGNIISYSNEIINDILLKFL